MDLHKQLHEVLYTRVLSSLAVITAVLWVQLEDEGLSPTQLIVAFAVLVAVTVPFFLLERSVPTRVLAGPMVATDIALITAGIAYTGWTLSPVAVFYVWPIVLAAVFLPAWAPYAAATAAGLAYVVLLRLQETGWLEAPVTLARIDVPADWALPIVSLHIAAFLIVALLAGRLAAALVRSSTGLAGAKAETEAQLRLLQKVNEQLVTMSESSRLLLRHQDVDTLMPNALERIGDVAGLRTAFVLVHNPNSGEWDRRAEQGDADQALIRKLRDLGIGEAAADGMRKYETKVADKRVGLLLKAVERDGFHGFVVDAARGDKDSFSVSCACSTDVSRPSPGRRSSDRGRVLRSRRSRAPDHPNQRGAGAQERGAHAHRRAQERLHGDDEPRATNAAHVGHRL